MFFQFFKILIFWVVRGVKGQKMFQNDKTFCPLRWTSQEPYLMYLSFMVHVYEIVISPGIFFIFSKFWYFGLFGWWKGKKQSKITKNCVCQAPYFRNHTSYDCYLWYTCVKWYCLQVVFSFFQNFDFLGC